MGDAGWPVEDLIRAAQDGNPAAVAALVTSSHPHVRRFAHSLCASQQDAEDAAQEALIVLYQKIGTLRATGALASWMFRIVRHECLRRARHAARWTAVPMVEGRVDSAEDDTLSRLEAQRVAEAIAALPEDQRHVLVMRDVLARPGPTAAAALGLSTAAMKSRLHRARTSVRTTLETLP